MPLQPPNLDDRTFQQIFEEARRRIPRYTPEWTDFNDSDPGIALLQLFSWMTEMTLYRLNQVPELSYIKFLQMLGVERGVAQPAVAHLTFEAKPGTLQPVSIPAGTRVSGPAGPDGAPLIYETDRGLDLVRAELTQVQVFDGFDFALVSDRNKEQDTTFQPLGWRPQVDSALYLGFEPADPDNPATDLFPSVITLRVFLLEGGQTPQAISVDDVAAPPPVDLRWEYKAGPSDPWRQLTLYGDETRALTRSGYITLQGPRRILPATIGKVSEAHYWLRARVISGSYGDAVPQVDIIRANTVPARNLATVREELMGQSDGSPDQSFTLRFKPVDAANLQLSVEDEGEVLQPWQQVDDFLASGPDDPHFTLQPMTGEVHFGDGRRGRMPTAGGDIVARAYRYGGGAAGNAAPDTITSLQGAITGVQKVTNLRKAQGGRDEESVDQAKERAAQTLRHRDRAVSADDFASLAKQVGGVSRALAVPLAHPDFPGLQAPGTVTVVIVPNTKEMPPQPSQDLLKVVADYLRPRRMVATEVYVRGPKFVKIRVEARVSLQPDVAFDSVALAITKKLNDYFDPQSWLFGADIYPTNVYAKVLELRDQGVVAVQSLTIYVDDRQHDAIAQRIVMPKDALPYAAGHDIYAVPAQEMG